MVPHPRRDRCRRARPETDGISREPTTSRQLFQTLQRADGAAISPSRQPIRVGSRIECRRSSDMADPALPHPPSPGGLATRSAQETPAARANSSSANTRVATKPPISSPPTDIISSQAEQLQLSHPTTADCADS